MIKPTDIDYTSPDSVLLSSEVARFKGFDLEDSEATQTILEDNDEFTVVEIEMTSLNGNAIKRQIKAFKNPEAPEEEPEPPVLVGFTFNPTPTEIDEDQTIALVLDPSNHVISSFDSTPITGVTLTRTGNDVRIQIDSVVVDDLAELTIEMTIDGITNSFDAIYEKTV